MKRTYVGLYRGQMCEVETTSAKLAQMICIGTFALENPRESIKAWDVHMMSSDPAFATTHEVVQGYFE